MTGFTVIAAHQEVTGMHISDQLIYRKEMCYLNSHFQPWLRPCGPIDQLLTANIVT